MKKNFSKHLTILLAASLLTAALPVQNVLAADTNSSYELEATPRYSYNSSFSIPNGGTYYLTNNGGYFTIRKNTVVRVEFYLSNLNDEVNFEFGIINSNGDIIYSDYFPNSNCLQGDFPIDATGQYKFYITNYSSDTKTFSGYKVVF